MPRERSPNRNKAFEIYRQSGGKIKPREIAKLLAVGDSQVRKWKSEDKWEDILKGALPNVKSNAPFNPNKTKHPEKAHWGNKFAVGHGAPQGNKNSVATGEFESIFFHSLEEDEIELINNMSIDKETLLKHEIFLLTIREKRMMGRISALKKQKMTVTSAEHEKGEKEKGNVDFTKEIKEGTLGQIQRIEESLTRVQEKKQKSIDMLHKFNNPDGSEDVIEDDGFIKALEGTVIEDWDDDKEDKTNI